MERSNYYYTYYDEEITENFDDGNKWNTIVFTDDNEITENQEPLWELDDQEFGSTETYILHTKTPLDEINRIAKDNGLILDRSLYFGE